METNKVFKVGDYVFLFFNKSGSIFSARILEKTIRETISDGPKTEFLLEAYSIEGEQITVKNLKFSEDKCKMFSSIDELKVELHEHVLFAVNQMIEECNNVFNSVSETNTESE